MYEGNLSCDIIMNQMYSDIRNMCYKNFQINNNFDK